MFEYLHENLILHTRVFYTLQRGKRNYSENVTDTMKRSDSYFEFEAYLYPPLMLLPITWARYGYTMDDVHTTYDKIDASYVWAISLLLLASTYEPESSSAGVRSTFQSLFTFLFISRKTIFDVFISSQNDFISKSTKSILCHERTDHKPLLPKVAVTAELFNECKQAIPKRPPSFCWTPFYAATIPFQDIQVIPVEYDQINGLVYMVRVVEKSVYDAIEVKPKLCVVTLPVVVLIGDEQKEYVLLEEACFFYVEKRAPAEEEQYRKKSKRPKSKRTNSEETEINQTSRKKKKANAK